MYVLRWRYGSIRLTDIHRWDSEPDNADVVPTCTPLGKADANALFIKGIKITDLPLDRLCTNIWLFLAPVWCNFAVSAPLECIKPSR